jgi:hypothetical protein
MEKDLLEVMKKTSELLRHARAKNQPEALPLTNALSYLDEAWIIVHNSKGNNQNPQDNKSS